MVGTLKFNFMSACSTSFSFLHIVRIEALGANFKQCKAALLITISEGSIKTTLLTDDSPYFSMKVNGSRD